MVASVLRSEIEVITPARFYCMPSEGVDLSPTSDILTNDEVIRLSGIALHLRLPQFIENGVSHLNPRSGSHSYQRTVSLIHLSVSIPLTHPTLY